MIVCVLFIGWSMMDINTIQNITVQKRYHTFKLLYYYISANSLVSCLSLLLLPSQKVRSLLIHHHVPIVETDPEFVVTGLVDVFKSIEAVGLMVHVEVIGDVLF
jgi:hypothetical protein